MHKYIGEFYYWTEQDAVKNVCNHQRCTPNGRTFIEWKQSGLFDFIYFPVKRLN